MFKLNDYRIFEILVSAAVAFTAEYLFNAPEKVVLILWIAVFWFLILSLMQDFIETISFAWSKGRISWERKQVLQQLGELQKLIEALK
jgi:hypothetical protein